MTVEIPQVTSLTIFMVQIESPSNASTLESVVSGFPNLHELEILGVVYRMGSAFAASQSRTGNPIKETRTVLLPRLRRLVLHYLALTNSLFSSLLIPNVETLVLRDFEPGFDPRDIRFNTTLASHRDPQSSPIDSPGPTTTTTQETAGLQALPFGRFLANNDSLPQLRHLVLERIPDMVVRMCVDFVHIVDREATTTATTTAGRTTITGRTDGKSGSGGGLSHLLLADFRWPDWASLFPAEMPSEGSGSIPLPHLQHLEIQIDHNVGLRIVGGNSVRNETSVERQEWMNGLLKLAEWRMSPSAVVKMLREWNHEIPSWVVCQSSDDDSKTGNEHDHDRDQLLGRFGSSRTLQDVSLATGYVDSYPFLHAAWVALQREHTPGQDESSKSE
ncbi:hypothetical protein FRC15_006209 [Serendipita sp. 397]|nr:hypothetical protein FRC15_006209 [Serendipita sp. 397]